MYLSVYLSGKSLVQKSGFPWKRLQVAIKTSNTGVKAGSAREQLRLLTAPK